MPYVNIHRGARISPTKVRLVVDMVRGKSLDEAMAILELSKKRAAVFVKRALRSAQANAEMQEADRNRLYVSDARVDKGPTMKRWQPKDRGRAHPIMKRTSHITIAVDER